MKKVLRYAKKAIEILEADEGPGEPAYDPAQLGAVFVIVMAVVGALYWLLWTLLVYEGGLLAKIIPALQVLTRQKTLRDFGYEGSPYAMGLFEGWVGNVIALVLCVAVFVSLHRLYQEGAKRAKK